MGTALHAEVGALMSRYFLALDDRDFPGVRACFAAEATAHYDRPLVGVAAIIAHLREAMGRCAASTHIGGSLVMAGSEDAPEAWSTALAFLVMEHDEAVRIRLRGLRYRDQLVRRDGNLVFQRRERVAEWSFEVPGERLAGAIGWQRTRNGSGTTGPNPATDLQEETT